MDLLRARYGRLPATRPMEVAVDLAEGAHVILDDPAYLCPRGDLWVTRADAPPTNAVLAQFSKSDFDEHVHLVRENVLYVHWNNESGMAFPELVCRRDDGQIELVRRSGRRTLPLAHDYHWDRAFPWEQYIVVPSDRGVGMLKLGREFSENYCELLETLSPATAPASQSVGEESDKVTTTPFTLSPGHLVTLSSPQPQIVLDTRGLLAWIPWENGQPGSRGAWRFVEDRWSPLGPEQNWPEKILHLVPLLDGSVLQLIAQDANGVKLAMGPLDQTPIDQDKIVELVRGLGDPDKDKRRAAQEQLTLYGPSAWPVLEKYVNRGSAEMRERLKQILVNRIAPTLGNMSLLDGKMRPVARFRDGGVVFFADAGVSIPNGQEEATIVTPAWISIRPGWPIGLCPEALVADLKPNEGRLDFLASANEWLVTDEVHGPRQLVGNQLIELLPRRERQFSQLVGIDYEGRWLFRPKAAPVRIADLKTQPQERTQTLVLDPRLPSFTPRLPGWELVFENGETGWDKDNWPAMKRGGAWAFHERQVPMDDKENPIRKDPKDIPPASQPATDTTTQASTRAATQQAASQPSDAEPALLVDPSGNRYYEGLTSLRRVGPDGKQIVWPLPANATGRGLSVPAPAPVVLIRAEDGKLYLFNEPGRVLRIGPTPDEAEPFALEATFTRLIPSTEVRRIWLDPAGRICIVHQSNHLTLLFPQGHIPQEIAVQMPTEALKAAREAE